MKFKDHYISDSKGGTDIFSFIERRKTMVEYRGKIDTSKAFELFTEVALESDKSPKLDKLYKELKNIQSSIDRAEERDEELLKSLDTIKIVLKKLDEDCQRMTEPKTV